jgi:hypothetical protein
LQKKQFNSSENNHIALIVKERHIFSISKIFISICGATPDLSYSHERTKY